MILRLYSYFSQISNSLLNIYNSIHLILSKIIVLYICSTSILSIKPIYIIYTLLTSSFSSPFLLFFFCFSPWLFFLGVSRVGSLKGLERCWDHSCRIRWEKGHQKIEGEKREERRRKGKRGGERDGNSQRYERVEKWRGEGERSRTGLVEEVTVFLNNIYWFQIQPLSQLPILNEHHPLKFLTYEWLSSENDVSLSICTNQWLMCLQFPKLVLSLISLRLKIFCRPLNHSLFSLLLLLLSYLTHIFLSSYQFSLFII